MNAYDFKTETWGNIVRVNKRRARNIYNSGGTVLVQSCKFVPENPFQPAFELNLSENAKRHNLDLTDPQLAFDTWVNSYEWYNCQENETGYYAAFYVQIEKS